MHDGASGRAGFTPQVAQYVRKLIGNSNDEPRFQATLTEGYFFKIKTCGPFHHQNRLIVGALVGNQSGNSRVPNLLENVGFIFQPILQVLGQVDAGEIGAGHTVTALYEIVLQDSDGKRMEPLRYGGGKREEAMPENHGKLNEAAMISLRYKLPDEDKSTLYRDYLQLSDVEAAKGGDNIRFAASVAGFAQLLRGGQFLGEWGWDDAKSLAQASKGDDLEGYRGELIQLVGMAQLLDDQTAVASQ